MKMDSADFVTNLTGAMLALGVLGRGAIGARHMMQPKPSLTADNIYRRPVSLPQKKKEEEQAPQGMLSKLGNEAPPIASHDSSITNPIGRWFSQLQQGTNWTSDNHPADSHGDSATSIWGVPSTYAYGLPLGLAGLYAGYKGTDWLLDKRRKAEQQNELDDAKAEYDRVSQEMLQKRSVDEEPGTTLTELAELVIKEAGGASVWDTAAGIVPGPIREGWAATGGMYKAYAVLAALAAGKATYDITNSRSDKKLTEEAVRRRQQKRRRPTYIQPAGL